MYNLIEYSKNYWKISGNSWQYYRVKPALTDDGAIKNVLVGILTVLRLNLNKK